MHITSTRPLRLLAMTTFMVVLGVVGGLLVQQWRTPSAEPTANSHSESGWGMPQPKSYAELLKVSDMIVVGTVGDIVEQGTFGGYGKDGKMINPSESIAPGVNYIDYRVDVEQVVRDDGTIQRGGSVILRMNGDRGQKAIDPEAYFPLSAKGDRHLFFLTQTPDSAAYGLVYGPWSRLNIDGETVTYSDGQKSLVNFALGYKPTDFVKQLATESELVPREKPQ